MKTVELKGPLGRHLYLTADSQYDLAAAYVACDNVHSDCKDAGWIGASAKEAQDAMKYGSSKYVDQVESFMGMVTMPEIDVNRWKRVERVTGPRFNYAKAMRGQVRCCERMQRTRDDLAPLTVVYDVAVSGGQDHESILRRGAATLALVKELTAVRDVTLVVVCGLRTSGHTSIVSSVISCDPLDLARASWVMCSPAYLRTVMFGICADAALKRSGGRGRGEHQVHWAFSNHTWQQEHLPQYVADLVGKKGDEALVIPGLHLNDGHFDSDEAASSWVQKKMEELSGHR